MTCQVSKQLQESWPSLISAATLSKPSRSFCNPLCHLINSCASCSSCYSQESSIPCSPCKAGGHPCELWSMPKCAMLVLVWYTGSGKTLAIDCSLSSSGV